MATLQAKICNLLGFDPNRHNWKTEVFAGITSFLTMSYILAVNPSMFGILDGMPQGTVFTTTTLVALISLGSQTVLEQSYPEPSTTLSASDSFHASMNYCS